MDLSASEHPFSAEPGTEEVIVTGRRIAPDADPGALLTNTAKSFWNVDGNPLQPQAGCQANYTTVGGQPARLGDFTGAKGVRDCWF